MGMSIIGSSRERFLPHDVVVDILKRLPVKTLARFRCVAKDWLKLLRSPNFIAEHFSHSASNNAFFLFQQNYLSFGLIGPDLVVHNPQSVEFEEGEIIGSCNGLLCVRHANNNKLFLLNPATRQVKQVLETVIDIRDEYDAAFGFGHVANDYKIVRISSGRDREDDTEEYFNVPVNRAEVYSLTTRSWKEIYVTHLQNLCITFSSISVTVNGAMFWRAEMFLESDPKHEPDFMLSFDIAQEVFTQLRAPPPPESTHPFLQVLTVHTDKLAMFRCFHMENYQSYTIDLWVLEDTCAARENWVRKLSVGPFPKIFKPACFWRDNIVCWDDSYIHNEQVTEEKTLVYLINPYSGELKNFPVRRNWLDNGSFNYAESLVPVDNIPYDH